METILTLNSGQHILFGFLMTSLQGRSGRTYTIQETIQIAGLVKELTSIELYDNVCDTPDVQVMTKPEQTYQIFDEWFDENENYFEKFLSEQN
jgi:hypothetical protein